MMSIAQYYLGVTAPVSSAPRPQSMSQVPLSRSSGNSSTSPTTATSATKATRQSMPPPSRNNASAVVAPSPVQAVSVEDTSTFINQSPGAAMSSTKIVGPTIEEPENEHAHQDVAADVTTEDEEEAAAAAAEAALQQQRRQSRMRGRNGTMDREFRFPPPSMSPTTGSAPGSISTIRSDSVPTITISTNGDADPATNGKTAPSPIVEETQSVKSPGKVKEEIQNVEVPPPPPVEKERVQRMDSLEGDEDVGPTEEISLN